MAGNIQLDAVIDVFTKLGKVQVDDKTLKQFESLVAAAVNKAGAKTVKVPVNLEGVPQVSPAARTAFLKQAKALLSVEAQGDFTPGKAGPQSNASVLAQDLRTALSKAGVKQRALPADLARQLRVAETGKGDTQAAKKFLTDFTNNLPKLQGFLQSYVDIFDKKSLKAITDAPKQFGKAVSSGNIGQANEVLKTLEARNGQVRALASAAEKSGFIVPQIAAAQADLSKNLAAMQSVLKAQDAQTKFTSLDAQGVKGKKLDTARTSFEKAAQSAAQATVGTALEGVTTGILNSAKKASDESVASARGAVKTRATATLAELGKRGVALRDDKPAFGGLDRSFDFETNIANLEDYKKSLSKQIKEGDLTSDSEISKERSRVSALLTGVKRQKSRIVGNVLAKSESDIHEELSKSVKRISSTLGIASESYADILKSIKSGGFSEAKQAAIRKDLGSLESQAHSLAKVDPALNLKREEIFGFAGQARAALNEKPTPNQETLARAGRLLSSVDDFSVAQSAHRTGKIGKELKAVQQVVNSFDPGKVPPEAARLYDALRGLHDAFKTSAANAEKARREAKALDDLAAKSAKRDAEEQARGQESRDSKERAQRRADRARSKIGIQAIRDNGGLGSVSTLPSHQVDDAEFALERRKRVLERLQDRDRARFGANPPAAVQARDVLRSKEIHETTVAMSRLNKEVRGFSGLMYNAGIALRSFLRYAVGYGGLFAVTGFFSGLVKSSAEFEDKLKEIKAVARATDDEMATLSATIKNVGENSRFSLTEVAEAAKILAQAGQSAEETRSALEPVANLALAAGSSLSDAAETVVSFQEVFSNLDFSTVSDQLTAAVNVSKLTIEDLKSLLNFAAQTAKSLNVSSEQLLSAGAFLSNVGVRKTTIATGMRRLLTEGLIPDAKFTAFLVSAYGRIGESLGEEVGATLGERVRAHFLKLQDTSDPLLGLIQELRKLGVGSDQEITSKFVRSVDFNAASVALPLVARPEGYAELQPKISSLGQAASGASTRMDSAISSFKNLGTAISSLTDSALRDTIVALGDVSKGLAGFVNWVRKLVDELNRRGDGSLADNTYNAAAGGIIAASRTRGGFLKKSAAALTGAAAGGVAGTATEAATGSSFLSFLGSVLSGIAVGGAFGSSGGPGGTIAGGVAGGLRATLARVLGKKAASSGIPTGASGRAAQAAFQELGDVKDIAATSARAGASEGLMSSLIGRAKGLLNRWTLLAAVPFGIDIAGLFDDSTDKVKDIADAAEKLRDAAAQAQGEADRVKGLYSGFSGEPGTFSEEVSDIQRNRGSFEPKIFRAKVTGAASSLLTDFQNSSEALLAGRLDGPEKDRAQKLVDTVRASGLQERVAEGIPESVNGLLAMLDSISGVMAEMKAHGEKATKEAQKVADAVKAQGLAQTLTDLYAVYLDTVDKEGSQSPEAKAALAAVVDKLNRAAADGAVEAVEQTIENLKRNFSGDTGAQVEIASGPLPAAARNARSNKERAQAKADEAKKLLDTLKENKNSEDTAARRDEFSTDSLRLSQAESQKGVDLLESSKKVAELRKDYPDVIRLTDELTDARVRLAESTARLRAKELTLDPNQTERFVQDSIDAARLEGGAAKDELVKKQRTDVLETASQGVDVRSKLARAQLKVASDSENFGAYRSAEQDYIQAQTELAEISRQRAITEAGNNQKAIELANLEFAEKQKQIRADVEHLRSTEGAGKKQEELKKNIESYRSRLDRANQKVLDAENSYADALRKLKELQASHAKDLRDVKQFKREILLGREATDKEQVQSTLDAAAESLKEGAPQDAQEQAKSAIAALRQAFAENQNGDGEGGLANSDIQTLLSQAEEVLKQAQQAEESNQQADVDRLQENLSVAEQGVESLQEKLAGAQQTLLDLSATPIVINTEGAIASVQALTAAIQEAKSEASGLGSVGGTAPPPVTYGPLGAVVTPGVDGRAAGGPVRGATPFQRSGTDRIPALLDHGEYVIPKKSVARFGVGFFDSLRDLQMPRFAAGGSVQLGKRAQPNADARSRTTPVNLNVGGNSYPMFAEDRVVDILKRTLSDESRKAGKRIY